MSPSDFTAWLDAYGKAWESGDPEAVIGLFSSDAAYYETPFDPPMVGREAIRRYWSEGAEAGQRDVHFSYQIVTVIDMVGYARWQARFVRIPSGSGVELDGFLAAAFDENGRCIEFREWWHRHETTATNRE